MPARRASGARRSRGSSATRRVWRSCARRARSRPARTRTRSWSSCSPRRRRSRRHAHDALAEARQPRYWGLPWGLAQLLDLSERRRELVDLFAWAIPNDAALDVLARYAPLLECGAGTGYWLALLRARGVDAIGYDLAPPGDGAANAYHQRARLTWTDVPQGSAASAARRHSDRNLVLCWPPYDDDAASYAALRAYCGDVAIHIGERDGASGSVRFHRELALNWTAVEEIELPHWPRLDDRLVVYWRNRERRAATARDRCGECGRFMPVGALGRCDAVLRGAAARARAARRAAPRRVHPRGARGAAEAGAPRLRGQRRADRLSVDCSAAIDIRRTR